MKETTRSYTGVANRNAIDARARRACNNNDKSHIHANTRTHVFLVSLTLGYVTPRERRRDRRRVRERALLPCVDLTSRSCRDVELRAYKKSRSSARSRTARRAPSGSDALWRPHALHLCVRVYTWCVCTHGRGLKPTNAPTNQPINLRVQ